MGLFITYGPEQFKLIRWWEGRGAINASRPFFRSEENLLMTLEEIHAYLLTRTRRVDKSAELRTSVRKAIRTVHTAAYFPIDIVEEEVDLGGMHTTFKIPLPPRVRKFLNIAPLDVNGHPIAITTPDNTYEHVEATDIINSHFERKSDIYYVAGGTLTVKGSVGASRLFVSFYALPEVSDNNLETWLMRDYETVFIDAALADFYSQVGQQQLAANARQEMMIALQQLINDYVNMGEV